MSSSPIYEAMVTSMTAQMNPEHRKAAEWVDSQIAERKLELVSSKAACIAELRKLISQARDEGAEPGVIDAYERLMQQATAL